MCAISYNNIYIRLGSHGHGGEILISFSGKINDTTHCPEVEDALIGQSAYKENPRRLKIIVHIVISVLQGTAEWDRVSMLIGFL